MKTEATERDVYDPRDDSFVGAPDEDYLADLRTDIRCARRDGLDEYADKLEQQLDELEDGGS